MAGSKEQGAKSKDSNRRRKTAVAAAKRSKNPPPLSTTAELAGDAANPRAISDEGSAGLLASIKRFGDLAGITFNRRTGELVTGHQRMAQIRSEYGDRAIELIDAATDLYGIRIDATHFFPVRVVDWSPAVQRAANVAANNQKIQGQFTNDLSAYLLSVEAELAHEMPGVLADCLLVELMAAGLDATTADEDSDEVRIHDSFQVIVQCNDEDHQRSVYEQLTGAGLSCKVLTI